MDTKKLLLAIKLGETLHFGKTAELENMAQSGLSAKISALESELGFRLFTRANRRVALTEAGEKFIDKAKIIINDVHNTVLECKAISDSQRSVIKIGFFGDSAPEHTHSTFLLFRKMNPDIKLVFVELQMTNLVQSLVSGSVDVVLMRLPVYDDRFEYFDLFDEPRLAVVPVTHPLAQMKTLSVADLFDKPFAIPESGAPVDMIAYWSLADERNEPSRIATTVRSVSEVIAAVAYGGAFNTAPASFAKVHSHPGIRYIPLENASYSTMSLVTLQGNRRPGIRALCDCAVQTIRNAG